MGKHTCGECTRHGGAWRHRQRVSPHPCQGDERQQKRGMSTEANRDKHPSAHTKHRCCGCDPLHPQCNVQRHQMNEEEGVRAHSSPCATYNAGEEQWRTRRRKSEITWSSSTLELAKCRRTARTSSSRLQSTSTFRPYAARYRLRESYWSASKLATVPRVAPAAAPPPLPLLRNTPPGEARSRKAAAGVERLRLPPAGRCDIVPPSSGRPGSPLRDGGVREDAPPPAPPSEPWWRLPPPLLDARGSATDAPPNARAAAAADVDPRAEAPSVDARWLPPLDRPPPDGWPCTDAPGTAGASDRTSKALRCTRTTPPAASKETSCHPPSVCEDTTRPTFPIS